MHTYTVQRAVSLLAVIAMAFCVAGCGEREPKKSDTPPPPPPTPEQDAQTIMGNLQLNGPLPAAGSTMPEEESTKFLMTLRTAKNQNSTDAHGAQVLLLVSQKLDSRLRALEKNELWEHVLTYCDGHLILNPGSPRFNRTRDKTISELRKPRVTIDGFFYDGKTSKTFVFMYFYLPNEKKTYREQVRVGEEFYGLKLVEIIGNNQGVTMEYLETDETFDVLK